MSTFIERSVGCMLGAAFGDSLGAGVEFLTKEQILRQHGPRGIREPLGFPGCGRGSITDDTQQALCVAAACLHGIRRAGGTHAPYEHIRRMIVEDAWIKLKQWKDMQDDPQFSRSAGATSLMALTETLPGTFEHPINQSDSCGAVMRAHPIGLLYAGDPMHAFDLGMHVGAITHGSPDGYAPAGALAAIIARTLLGETIRSSITQAIELVRARVPSATKTVSILEHALALKLSKTEADLGRHALGWNGWEALAIGCVAAMRSSIDLVEACSFAATHDGDSDTTASIAGAIVGSKIGVNGIPHPWQHSLERAHELAQRGFDLQGLNEHIRATCLRN